MTEAVELQSVVGHLSLSLYSLLTLQMLKTQSLNVLSVKGRTAACSATTKSDKNPALAVAQVQIQVTADSHSAGSLLSARLMHRIPHETTAAANTSLLNRKSNE